MEPGYGDTLLGPNANILVVRNLYLPCGTQCHWMINTVQPFTVVVVVRLWLVPLPPPHLSEQGRMCFHEVPMF